MDVEQHAKKVLFSSPRQVVFAIRLVNSVQFFYWLQRAKKVVSDSPGLVDFAIGLVNSVFKLPARQVMLFEQFK